MALAAMQICAYLNLAVLLIQNEQTAAAHFAAALKKTITFYEPTHFLSRKCFL